MCFYVGGLHVNPKDGKIDDWIGATIAKYTHKDFLLLSSYTGGTIPPSSPLYWYQVHRGYLYQIVPAYATLQLEEQGSDDTMTMDLQVRVIFSTTSSPTGRSNNSIHRMIARKNGRLRHMAHNISSWLIWHDPRQTHRAEELISR